MIKVAFDASSLVRGTKSGVAYYTQGLVENLARQYPDDIELIGHYCNFLGRRKFDLPQAPNIRYRQTRLLPVAALNALRRLGLPLPFELLIKNRADFHLFPAFIGWPSLFRTPSAPVVHDVTYLEYPELVSRRALGDLKRFVPAAIRRADFVITISETSSASLKKHYGLESSQLAVTHVPPVGVNRPSKQAAAERLAELNINPPYILFLGNLEPRKNLTALLDAYSQLEAPLRQKYGLVLAGGKGWHDSEILSRIEGLKADDYNIMQSGYVSDEQRAALFETASLFVLPSLYEGFGMTLLEAMAYETPVIASDIAIFHEVCGDAGLFFDPAKPAELADRISSLLGDPELQKQLVSKGRDNLKRFSWPEVAKTVYNRVKHG